MLDDLRLAIAHCGPQNVIVENVPYRGEGGQVMRACVEPVIIRQVLEETGAGLLLDISHARISAHSLGMEARSYIEALPLERLRELHFTGIHVLEDGRWQDHLSALEADWIFLDWVLGEIRDGSWGCEIPGVI
jgi:uncharacterized protein (UPF0276 family)